MHSRAPVHNNTPHDVTKDKRIPALLRLLKQSDKSICVKPAFIVTNALRKSDGTAEQHDVPVTGQTTQIAEKLQEHLQLAALHHRCPWQQTRLIVWQHVTLILSNVRTGTCQMTNRTCDWLMASFPLCSVNEVNVFILKCFLGPILSIFLLVVHQKRTD